MKENEIEIDGQVIDVSNLSDEDIDKLKTNPLTLASFLFRPRGSSELIDAE